MLALCLCFEHALRTKSEWVGVWALLLWSIGATISLNQSVYAVSEDDGFLEVCVDLVGELERSIEAEILLVRASAAGQYLRAVHV